MPNILLRRGHRGLIEYAFPHQLFVGSANFVFDRVFDNHQDGSARGKAGGGLENRWFWRDNPVQYVAYEPNNKQ